MITVRRKRLALRFNRRNTRGATVERERVNRVCSVKNGIQMSAPTFLEESPS